jgi:hypothetical protein
MSKVNEMMLQKDWSHLSPVQMNKPQNNRNALEFNILTPLMSSTT